VNGLNLLVKHFLNPLRSNATSPRPFITMDQIRLLFSELEVMIHFVNVNLTVSEDHSRNKHSDVVRSGAED
jgi:hypothetical protein